MTIRIGSHDYQYQPGTPPSPELIQAARLAVGHTQEQAAETVHVRPRTWEDREYGRGRMSAAEFELYCRLAGLWPGVDRDLVQELRELHRQLLAIETAHPSEAEYDLAAAAARLDEMIDRVRAA